MSSVPPAPHIARVKVFRVLNLSRTATETAVRNMLSSLVETLESHGIDPDLLGSVQIAVAEALNNVVEHAYTGAATGPLTLAVDLGPDSLHITITDQGQPLPGGRIPPGVSPDLSVPRADLPEGGFGWFLMHTLARDISYSRKSGLNTLRISFFRHMRPQSATKP